MFQYGQGKHNTQGHKGIPENHFEEEQGRKGFFGPVSHLIKKEPSTRWSQIEGPLKPQLFDLVKMPSTQGKWQRLFFNASTTVSRLNLHVQAKPDSAFRNADGDTLYFVHKGKGSVLTEYGILNFREGHYLNLPKCVHHTFVTEAETEMLVIESHRSFFREPDRGMLGRNGFYDLAAIGKPDLQGLQDWQKKTKHDILKIEVKKQNQKTVFYYQKDIYDTVGWKGDFFPYSLHIDDLMPIQSHRVHLPPSAHTTFVADGFVVCTFLPRPLETDADALKVPFYHQNIDYDEILFYHAGNFFSRDNLHANMMTLHPSGFPHGPHPKAVKGVAQKTHTDEVAVMIDSWLPFERDPLLDSVSIESYWKSWMTP